MAFIKIFFLPELCKGKKPGKFIIQCSSASGILPDSGICRSSLRTGQYLIFFEYKWTKLNKLKGIWQTLQRFEKNTLEAQQSLKILYLFLHYYPKDPGQNFSCSVSIQDQFLNSSFLLYPRQLFCWNWIQEGTPAILEEKLYELAHFLKDLRCFYHVLTIYGASTYDILDEI